MEKKESMPWIPKLCYGVGHFMNDLCAAMWFSYILLFYESVLKFNDMTAGYIMLVGQIADGLSTPTVGILADMENKIPICARYGRRKIIHLLGTILVIISFPFIFNECLGCEDSSKTVTFVYHAIFVIVFQFAWACVQVSHLSLIPVLASKKSQRTELNSIRYAFMVLANMLVFVITFIFLGVGAFEDDLNVTTTIEPNSTTSVSLYSEVDYYDTSSGGIGPQHLTSFRNVALTCIGIGTIFSIIFHVGTREPHFVNAKDCDPSAPGKRVVQRMRKRDWFKLETFYQVAAMYTVTRLYVNLYMTYIPLFVNTTINMDVIFVAVVPMIMHFSSFLASFAMKPVNRIIGRKRTFTIGCGVGVAACIWIGAGAGDYFAVWGIYPVAVLLGVGGSILLITSLSITADLIGDNSEGGAFVYGVMSLLDKVSNGIAIMLIQKLDDKSLSYYRQVLTYACGIPCILGVLITLTLYKSRVGGRPREPSIDEIMSENDPAEEGNEDVDKPRLDSVANTRPDEGGGSLGLEAIEDGSSVRQKDLCNGLDGKDNPAFESDTRF